MSGDYVLGVNASELDRLRFQQEVWGAVTDRFLDRLGVASGWRVLDAGCGPGFVVASLRQRVGAAGEVVALDESPVWIEQVTQQARAQGWHNVRPVAARLQAAELAPRSFDLIFLRWVLSFPPDPGAIVARLARALKPGGVLAVQDYNHEGISLFPESAGFKAVVAGTRQLYRSRGGDPWIAARLPGLFHAAGLTLVELTPNALCGGPDSPAFLWADRFFPAHSENMVKAGALTAADRAVFLREWEERRRDPHAVFFSPLVVDAAARAPR